MLEGADWKFGRMHTIDRENIESEGEIWKRIMLKTITSVLEALAVRWLLENHASAMMLKSDWNSTKSVGVPIANLHPSSKRLAMDYNL